MFKSKLYWKVLGNFGLLLIILTAMTVLTLNILSQIQRNFSVATGNIRVLANLEKVRHYLVDVPEAAYEYAFTGSSGSQAVYINGWRNFDVAMTNLQRELPDSVSLQKVRLVRELYFSWMQNVGDKIVLLRDEKNPKKQIEAEMRELSSLESQMQYMPAARRLIRELYELKISSQPRSLELATSLSSDLGRFITIVNVLLAVFSLALGFVLTRSITSPVRLLKDGTKQIMQGNFEPIELNRSDELGELAADFNNMSVMLGNNYTRLNAYSELVTALNTHAEVETVEVKSLELLCQHSQSSVGAMYLLDKGGDKLTLTTGYALRGNHESIKEYAFGEGIPGQCASLLKVLEVKDVETAGGFAIDTGLVEVLPKHILAVPMLFQDKLMGVLVFGSMSSYDELRKEIIVNSVPQVGVAVTNARNYEASKKLSEEVAKRNEELDAKNAELQKAYRVKSDFLASMSHELRTPLNSIIGFSSVLLGPNSDPLTDDQRRGLEKVLKNGKHLLQLINDILDFSKLESGRMTVNVESDEVSEVVANSIMTVESLVKSKNVAVKQDVEPGLPQLVTDVLKVKQILVNLLSNAAKFTEEGEICVTARRYKNMISIAVKDTGIGIEEKNLEKVFEEFQQIDSSNTRKYKGTGLGLSIARRLARVLGGDLTVESVYGHGSTFMLIIPPVYPQEAKEKPEDRTAGAPAKPTGAPAPTAPVPLGANEIRILCIDDDPDVIEILRKYLIPEGYSVIGALSGDEGIRKAHEMKPSLITLDIMMPQKDGWQVLRELKQDPLTRDIPVIIHSMIDNKPLALSLGAVGVMPKPVEPQYLLSVVEQNCKKKTDEFVLIVDDNEDYSIMLRELLERDGFHAKVANSGEEALKILAQSMPAIIFLDLVMPKMDGIEVVRRLEQNERWRSIPVVILSGKELTDDERQQLNNHIQNFMQKSQFSREAISNTIKRILHQSPQQRN